MSLPVFRVMEQRRARRAITDKAIPSEVVDTLIEAAHLAPSCANGQPWRFVVVDEPKTLATVKASLTGGNYWALRSPVIIAVTSRPDLGCTIPGGRDTYLFDTGLAVAQLLLQATDQGLIAHPIAGFKQSTVREALEIPSDFVVIALVILGVPTENLSGLSEKHRREETSPRIRRPLSDISSRNRFTFSDQAPMHI